MTVADLGIGVTRATFGSLGPDHPMVDLIANLN